jgi:hypothetical protein
MAAAMGMSRHIAHVYRIFLTLWIQILAGTQRASADCECGYSSTVGFSSTVGLSSTTHVFTDLIESDFTKLGDVSWNTDWQRQAFNVSAQDARGKYGESMDVDNVAVRGGGLALTVRSTTTDGMVSTAEIDTTRLDVLWGTFRAGLKLSSVPGTCSAFFWVSMDGRHQQGVTPFRPKLTSRSDSSITTHRKSISRPCPRSSTQQATAIQSI